MSKKMIEVHLATADEQESCQHWDLWESGELTEFNYDYDQDVEFIVQSGEAHIRTNNDEEVTINAGCHVVIHAGVSACWDIRVPIVNRYLYRSNKS